jgi:hypothetical protein
MNPTDIDTTYKFKVDSANKRSLGSSSIINLSELGGVFDKIESLVGKTIRSVSRCYRAAESSYSSSTMHVACSGKGANLVVYKSTTGRIFGGYTTLGFSRNGGYRSDAKAFLYRYFNGKVETIQSKGDSYTTYSTDGYGPTFGGGHDLYIPNSCHSA